MSGSVGLKAADELIDRATYVRVWSDELEPAPVRHRLVGDVGDTAVHDASFGHEDATAEFKPQVMQRIELEREGGFDLCAGEADFPDADRLKHHDLAAQTTGNFDAVVAAVGRGIRRVR